MECAICFEPKKFRSNIWKCEHEFCADCSQLWDGLCPICRSERNFNIRDEDFTRQSWCEKICGLRPRRRHSSNSSSITVSTYLYTWVKASCITSHSITFKLRRNFEVVGTCVCGEKQYFPFMG